MNSKQQNSKVADPKIDELQQIALIIGTEHWTSAGTGTIYCCESSPITGPVESGKEIAEVYLREDGKDEARQAFIASANPAVVLELIGSLLEAREHLATIPGASSDAISEKSTFRTVAVLLTADEIKAALKIDTANGLVMRIARTIEAAVLKKNGIDHGR